VKHILYSNSSLQGYKGQRKIIKRVAAPKQWYLGKLRGVYSVRPSAGPHKLRECIPMSVLLQHRLKYAFTTGETRKIANDKQGLIKVDGKVRRNHRFPLGNMDVVTIDKTNEHFRILYDTKGRMQPHRLDAKEASFKLAKIVKKVIGKNKIPYIVTHDGRTIRYPHPDIEIGDSVKLNLATFAIDGVIKFQNGATVMIAGGNNTGRIGVLTSIEKHVGSYDICHVKDSRGNSFSTRIGNVFIIGDGKSPAISLPKGQGIALTLMEERDNKQGDEEEDDE
jgi:small subunit ribosomal protein S4e